MKIRHPVPGDVEALYDISLKTGDSGKDASPLHEDPRLIGLIYSVPYALLLPDWTFVAEDEGGLIGYVAGVPDTHAFERLLEEKWWPELRQRYADPGPPPNRNADEARWYQIHHPDPPPAGVVRRFPAHMHMNVLPRAQRKGLGTALFAAWQARAEAGGVHAVHVGVSPVNPKGQAFWQACGMVRIPDAETGGHRACWFGKIIGEDGSNR